MKNTLVMKIWHEPIPPIIFTKLKDACIERRKEEDWNYNDKLVGALNQQSSLVATEGLEDYLIKTSENIWYSFFQTCPWEGAFDPSYLTLRNLWVNYQKPGQYNPYHCHHGVVSFVIFVDIPYGVEERADFASDGGFQLENELINIDRSWNGQILMFPSQMNHGVYPYKSTDKERVTVAGNMFWNAAK